MRRILILSLFSTMIYITVSADQNALLQVCLKEENMTMAQVQAAIKAEKYENLNCVEYCILEKVDMIQDNKFNVKLLSYHLKLSLDQLKDTVKHCTNELVGMKLARCDVPLHLQNCMMSNSMGAELLE